MPASCGSKTGLEFKSAAIADGQVVLDLTCRDPATFLRAVQ